MPNVLRIHMRLAICLITTLIITACTTSEDKISEEDVYHFLNKVMAELSSDYKDCDAISDRTLLTIDGTFSTFPGEVYDSTATLRQLAEGGYIDTSDIDFILNQQYDTAFRLEPNKINKRLLRQEEIDSIFNLKGEVGYKILRETYGIECHGYISKPFFSKDRNTVLISLEWVKGYLYGQGLIIIFKKENEIWKEERVLGTWVS